MQFWCYVLPLVNKIGGSFLQCSLNIEHCNNWWNSNQTDLPCKNDSKASSTTSSYGPKNIFSH
uniref:Uncharacterized protein n=1 Tax=Cajanus cajan TaxID=3821 RepID=A0A151SYL5_CAJCA|nr:hypothetical protein KK1_015326 [Cajanus cajan]